jgi:outer membrane protein assembly factor BamB
VSDGARVYAFLGKAGVYAYDLDGNQLWQADVGKGSDRRRWGSASSPVLYENILIVPAIAESSSLVGLDKNTGKQIWKEESGSLESSWSTPLLVKVDDKKTDLVMPMGGEVWGLNPENGKLRWYCTDIPGDSFYTSVTSKDDVIFGSVGGRSGGGSFAIKVGGKGDVTKSHMTWTNGDQSSYATPVLHDGKMFIASRGIAISMKIDDGKQVAKVRLSGSDGGGAENAGGGSRFGGRGGGGGGSDYSSPVIAGDKLYYIKRNGETFVFSAAGDDLEQLAVNQVTTDQENFSASPAICDGQIFLRSDKHLYCIEEKAQAKAE